MNKRAAVGLALAALCLLPLLVSAQETDEPRCKDHPLVSRMKGFVIWSCESDFDAVEFYVDEEETKTLEGRKTVITYSLREGEAKPSDLQIVRNHENALKAVGGTVVY
jgi:mRNA-degrading endonuclease YafQ of YafQ-DinJ toxin-antitoxin module